MRHLTTAILLATAPQLAAQQPQTVVTSSEVRRSIGRIDAFVRRTFAVGATPGLGVGIVVNGHTFYTAALGHADAARGIKVSPSTLWYLASTSKSFTGFAIALLDARGELSIDQNLTELLPAVVWPEGLKPDEITLSSLLSHTHGINNNPLVLTEAFTGAIPRSRHEELLTFSTPRANRGLTYTNLGYNIASLVIDARRPEGWKAFVRREVFEPAGMANTFATVSGVPKDRIALSHVLQTDESHLPEPFEKRDVTMNAAGGHLATIGDLTRWISIHMDSGRLDGRRVFPATAVNRSHEILASRDARFAFFQRDGWGMGWDIGSYRDEPMVSRFGGYTGFRSHVSMLPQKRIGVVAQVNGSEGSAITDIIAAYAYDVLLGRSDADSVGASRLDSLSVRLDRAREGAKSDSAATAARRDKVLVRPVSEYAGIYEDSAYGRVTIQLDGTKLRLTWGVLSRTIESDTPADHRFVAPLPMGNVAVVFEMPATGAATALTIGGRRLPRQ